MYFKDVIDVAQHSTCKSCETLVYTLPCNIDESFEDFMFSVGGTEYPLKKIKMLRIDNEYLTVTSRVGRNWLEVKFKKNRRKMKPLWDLAVAAYVQSKNNIEIIMEMPND